jgi:hypothetical protein
MFECVAGKTVLLVYGLVILLPEIFENVTVYGFSNNLVHVASCRGLALRREVPPTGFGTNRVRRVILYLSRPPR